MCGDDVRRASTKFADKSAVAYDGSHLRYFGLLRPAGQARVAELFDAIEGICEFPDPVKLLVVALLGKPFGISGPSDFLLPS